MAALQERGFFWWFGERGSGTDSKPMPIPGLLTISDEGRINLETEGALCLEQVRPDWREPWIMPARLSGQLASGGKRVLLGSPSQ